jgi:RecB family endonuclease NucS
MFQDRPFATEAEMRDHLAKNLHLIEPGMQLVRKANQFGVEFTCPILKGATRIEGRIDILATDSGGGFDVIECKHGPASASALGQVLGYIAWFRVWFHSFVGPVRGIIVASSATPNLLRAIALVPDVEIRVYEHPCPAVFRRVA